MATVKKAQAGIKQAPKKIAGEMTGKMYKKSAIDKIGDAQAKELDKASVYGKGKKTAPKAKDGKWMQKAAASIKRRGTEGKCTPITKPGCTGRAKALAKTFKKIAAKRKAK
jgi:hypothetical protein